jgi:integrase
MPRKRRGRGEGGIGRQGDRWFAEVSLGFDGAGKRLRKRVYGTSKQAVQESLRLLQQQADRGGIPDAGSMTVGQTFDRWLAAMRPAWSPGTHQAHDQHVRNHIKGRLGSMRLAKLTALHVQDVAARMEAGGVSASMRRHVLVTLRAGLQWAVRMRLIPDNPSAPIELPRKQAYRSAGLTPAQVATFLKAAVGDRFFALYLLAVDSGLRQGELLALTWTDVDFARGTVTVTKSLEEVGGTLRVKEPKSAAAIRAVAISSSALGALTEHRRAMLAEGHCTPETPVFCGTRRGQHLRKSDLYRLSFAPILVRANLKFRFHDLRHSSASLLLADGTDIKTVQSRLGHSAAAITLDVYAHAIDRGQQVAADKMDAILKRASE